MPQPSFPLFQPALHDPPEDMVFSVSDVLDREVRRAALEGPDPEAIERQRISLDLDSRTLDAVQALAHATGSTRRAMATKLIDAAVWQAVNELCRNAQGTNAEPEYAAVLDVFQDAYNELRARRDKAA